MGMFASDPKEGRVLFLSLSFSLLQMDTASVVPGCCRGPGDAAGCSPTCEQEDRWAGHPPLLKPCLTSTTLNPMLFLLSAAKALLMRFSRLTRRLCYIAAIEINDSYMAKPVLWLWERRLLPVCACLLESTAVRSYEVAEDAVVFSCCRS